MQTNDFHFTRPSRYTDDDGTRLNDFAYAAAWDAALTEQTAEHTQEVIKDLATQIAAAVKKAHADGADAYDIETFWHEIQNEAYGLINGAA
jgi:hypothetical protein